MANETIKIPDLGGADGVEIIEVSVAVGDTIAAEAVSYTHLTLPTIYSV